MTSTMHSTNLHDIPAVPKKKLYTVLRWPTRATSIIISIFIQIGNFEFKLITLNSKSLLKLLNHRSEFKLVIPNSTSHSKFKFSLRIQILTPNSNSHSEFKFHFEFKFSLQIQFPTLKLHLSYNIMLTFLVLRHVNKIGFRTGVTFLVLSNCSAILYCEVCHQNVALNDNFCSHRGIQLPTEEL